MRHLRPHVREQADEAQYPDRAGDRRARRGGEVMADAGTGGRADYSERQSVAAPGDRCSVAADPAPPLRHSARAVGVHFIHQRGDMSRIHVGDSPCPRLKMWPSREPPLPAAWLSSAMRTCARTVSGRSVQHRRIEVALQHDLARGAARGVFERNRPVHAKSLAAAVREFLEVRRIALAEQDQRRAADAIAALEFARDADQVRQRETRGTSPATARRPRCRTPAAPARRPRAAPTGRRSRIGIDRQQPVHRGRIVQCQRLIRGKLSLPPPSTM